MTLPSRGRREIPTPRVIDLVNPERNDPAEGNPGKVHVLLVEDDPLFATLVVSILGEASAEFDVASVPRLSSALAHLVRERVDLLLTDLNLPDSSGSSTVLFLRRAAPEIPIIVLSAIDDVQVAVDAIREGADEYVVKGRFSVDELVWLVRVVLERQRRVLEARRNEDRDPLSGFASRTALQVVGRHLLRVADRTKLHLGVVFLGIDSASRGPWADWERLMLATCDVLQRTLRRCDLLSRVDRGELAVVLISEGALWPAVERLRSRLADGGMGAHVRIGFAPHDPENTTLDELLTRARDNAQPVLT
jgi:DNA-binding response OmpR family regulator